MAAGALGEQEGGGGRQVRRRHQNQLLHGVERAELLEPQTQTWLVLDRSGPATTTERSIHMAHRF